MNSRSDGSKVPEDSYYTSGALGANQTQWSVILRARSEDPAIARDALVRLLEKYSPLLKRYLCGGSWRFDPHVADDIVQGFVRSKILSGNLLETADPERGKFRSFLKVAIDNFTRDQIDNRRESPLPQGRGGDVSDELSLHASQIAIDPFDAHWAQSILQQAIAQLFSYCVHQRQYAVWDVFAGRLLRPVTGQGEPTPYEELALKCGLSDWKDAANALTTAKRIFRRVFEDLVGGYSNDIADEIRFLQATFAAGVRLDETLLPSFVAAKSIDNDYLSPFSSDQRSWLIACVIEPPHPKSDWSDEELGTVTQQLLDVPLWLLFRTDTRSNSGETPQSLRDLFAVPIPRLEELHAVKNWAKEQYSTGELALPPEIISLVFFASLVCAQLRLGVSLTRLGTDSLRHACLANANAIWCDEYIRRVLQVFLESQSNPP